MSPAPVIMTSEMLRIRANDLHTVQILLLPMGGKCDNAIIRERLHACAVAVEARRHTRDEAPVRVVMAGLDGSGPGPAPSPWSDFQFHRRILAVLGVVVLDSGSKGTTTVAPDTNREEKENEKEKEEKEEEKEEEEEEKEEKEEEEEEEESSCSMEDDQEMEKLTISTLVAFGARVAEQPHCLASHCLVIGGHTPATSAAAATAIPNVSYTTTTRKVEIDDSNLVASFTTASSSPAATAADAASSSALTFIGAGPNDAILLNVVDRVLGSLVQDVRTKLAVLGAQLDAALRERPSSSGYRNTVLYAPIEAEAVRGNGSVTSNNSGGSGSGSGSGNGGCKTHGGNINVGGSGGGSSSSSSSSTSSTSSTSSSSSTSSTSSKKASAGLFGTTRKRQAGRHEKQLGDIALMMGRPDAAERYYAGALKVFKDTGDTLWLAGAYEGHVGCLVLRTAHGAAAAGTSLSVAAISENRHRSGSKNDGNSMFNASANAAALRTLLSQVKAAYRKAGAGATESTVFIDFGLRMVELLKNAALPPRPPPLSQPNMSTTSSPSAAVTAGKGSASSSSGEHIASRSGSVASATLRVARLDALRERGELAELVMTLGDGSAFTELPGDGGANGYGVAEITATLALTAHSLGYKRKAAFYLRSAALALARAQRWQAANQLMLRAGVLYGLTGIEGALAGTGSGAAVAVEAAKSPIGTSSVLPSSTAKRIANCSWPRLQAIVLRELVYTAGQVGDKARMARAIAYLTGSVRDKRARAEVLPPLLRELAQGHETVALEGPLLGVPDVLALHAQPLIAIGSPVHEDPRATAAAAAAAGPFIYSALRKKNRGPAAVRWVAGEPAEAEVVLANLLPFDLCIDAVALRTTGTPCAAVSTPSLVLRAGETHRVVSLQVRPLLAGTLYLTGVTITACRMVAQHTVLGARAVTVLPPLPLLMPLPPSLGAHARALLMHGERHEALIRFRNTGAEAVTEAKVEVSVKGHAGTTVHTLVVSGASGEDTTNIPETNLDALPPVSAAFATASRGLAVDWATAQACLPLAPGQTLSLPITFHAGGPLGETKLKVQLSYSGGTARGHTVRRVTAALDFDICVGVVASDGMHVHEVVHEAVPALSAAVSQCKEKSITGDSCAPMPDVGAVVSVDVRNCATQTARLFLCINGVPSVCPSSAKLCAGGAAATLQARLPPPPSSSLLIGSTEWKRHALRTVGLAWEVPDDGRQGTTIITGDCSVAPSLVHPLSALTVDLTVLPNTVSQQQEQQQQTGVTLLALNTQHTLRVRMRNSSDKPLPAFVFSLRIYQDLLTGARDYASVDDCVLMHGVTCRQMGPLAPGTVVEHRVGIMCLARGTYHASLLITPDAVSVRDDNANNESSSLCRWLRTAAFRAENS